MVIAHVAHERQPWTSCRRRFTSERRSSRLRAAERVRPRQEARLVHLALRQLVLTQLRREPAHASMARPVCSVLRQLVANLPASRSAFTSIAPRAASASLDTASVLYISGLAQSSAWHATAFALFRCFRQVRNFALACILDSRPMIISDEESPFAEDFMGPRANLRMEPGRSSREPPLNYQRWTKISLSPRLPEAVPGCPGPWATPFCPFLAKTGGSRWAYFFFVAIIFPVQQLQTVYTGLSTGVYFWYYFVRRKDWVSFSTGSAGPLFTTSPSFSPHQRATA